MLNILKTLATMKIMWGHALSSVKISLSTNWLIVCCLASNEQYLTYIQDDGQSTKGWLSKWDIVCAFCKHKVLNRIKQNFNN
jgi:hypothetical protein